MNNDRDLLAEVLIEAESILRLAREQNLNKQGTEVKVEEKGVGEHCLNCGRSIAISIGKSLCIYCYEEWD